VFFVLFLVLQTLLKIPQFFGPNCRTSADIAEDLQDAVAIVGMSCRYPGANSIPEFWNLLIEGRDAIRQVTPDRWRKDQGCHTVPEQKTTQAGFLTCPVDEFDGKFFGISPMEMGFLDPQQRLLLEVIWESLEDGGIDPSSLKNTYTGIFMGEWTNDYKELIREQGNKEFYRTYMGNSPGSAAGRISFILGLTGPSVATESGCSSAMVAVDLACKSLRMGESQMAIAAGVNLLLHPFSTKDMAMVCAPDGHCKTFDASADGFGRAEGCGSLILKRYADAVNDGDRIWALIRGTGLAQEGPSRSLGTPTVQVEAMAMRNALVNSGVKPNQVSYVETHGTGTPVGDPMEVAAIAQVYSQDRNEPLTIGSVKTNVGHTESCSGITGIMKVVLSMQNEVIPPHRNFTELNPNVKLEAVPAMIPLEPKEWKKAEEGLPRFAGVSSFGITGTDAHAIIQETPDLVQPILDLNLTRLQNILCISAKNETALDELLKMYEKCLIDMDDSMDLADVCYTANSGRAHFQQRVAVTGKTVQDIVTKLQNQAYLRQQVPENKAKICFLYTGQGSQYPGMAQSLYNTSPIFRMNFDKCERLLREKYGVHIKTALWEEDNNNSSITRTIYSQTSIFCVEYCLTKLWKSYGIQPDCVLGHSLGEFAASCAAGILSLEDAIELVAERSRLIDNLPSGKMVAVKSTKKAVDNLLEKYYALNSTKDYQLDFAAVNSNDQVVLAGTAVGIEAFTLLCANNSLKTHVLASTHAFHSRHMDPMLPEYESVASRISYGKPTCTYISGMDGKIVEEQGDINAQYWVRHTRESVKFLEASKLAYQEGCRVYLEVGPQPVLCALTMMNCSDFGESISCFPSLRKNEEDWTTLLNTLGKLYVNGYDVNWKKFDQYFPRSKVTLPFYPFQRKPYWFEVKASSGGMISGTEIHPLIGCPLPNATAVKMYQTCVDLKKEVYIKDHCIGSKVIFPGAGYMEMILAAGHATTQSATESLPTPGTPLTVENLAIEAPLCIQENEACDIQILVSSEDMTSAGYKVAIHRRVNSPATESQSNKWLRHAHGQFSPFAVGYEDKCEDFGEIQTRCSEAVDLSQFYDKLSQIGLKFGDTFRSLKALRRGDKELLGEINVPANSGDYLCHPVVIDAMIQALMLSREQAVEKLIVPVTIRKFIWLAKSDSKTVFVHCSPDTSEGATGGESSIQAVLYDENGTKLALMAGAELIETSVEVILSALEQQKLHLPNLYEEAWRPTVGPLQARVALPECDIQTLVYKDSEGRAIQYNDDWNDEEEKSARDSDRICYLYVVRAFYELGWNPDVGDKISLPSFVSDLQIAETHTKLVAHFFNTILVEEGIVSVTGKTEWLVKALPPQHASVSPEISFLHSELNLQQRKDHQLTVACGEVLAKILLGKESALGILFPDDPTKISADVFYTEASCLKAVNKVGSHVLQTILSKLRSEHDGKEIVRFLEVGAGTGSSTKTLLPMIDESKIRYEYTYTDISQMFFTKAQKSFESYERNMKYRVLNVEDEPKAQGFVPHYYDIIIASNVMHATKDLVRSMANIRHLLRDSGIVLLVETNRPLRHGDLIFGTLEGYWLFTDHEVRPNHTIISVKDWENVLKKVSFESTTSMTCYDGQLGLAVGWASKTSPVYSALTPSSTADQSPSATWILMSNDCEYSRFFQRKLESVGKNVVLTTPTAEKLTQLSPTHYQIRPEEKSDIETLMHSLLKGEGSHIEGILYLWGLDQDKSDQAYRAHAFLNMSQFLLSTKFKAYPRVYVLTGGIMPVSDQAPCNPSSGTLWGMSRSLRSEQPNLTCRCIDLALDDSSEQKLEEIFMEIWNEDGENQVAYRDRKRYVVRFVSTKITHTDLPIPNSSRFSLTLPASKTIADLKFDVLGVYQLQGKEIEIKVKAAGMNFKDVLNVLKPDAQFEKTNSVGADFAGIVTAVGPEATICNVGDLVVGCNFESVPLPSHVKTLDDAVVPLPSRLTFAEGATLPAVFATAYYCLVTIGKLQKGETILIHTASGGVGICAIQIAQWIGANVIATAGSKRKRAYLRSIGIDNVFHSRNLSFGLDIERATGGNGVQMVLNSITGPGMKETSLKSCAPNARFVEMSKLNIWATEEVQELRPDVEYTIVDLTAVSQDTWRMLFGHLKNFLESESFKPIPYVRFNGVNIREALTYLQKAKHVGKVVCIMPEVQIDNGEFIWKTPMFNERSTYIITGGLGGIGMEVAKWMASSGAQHIVLVGRSEPKEVAQQAISQMRSQGKNIIVENIDVGDFEMCQELIHRISTRDSGLPPIRGVMHAAGCLSDAIIVNQSWDKFQKCFNAKVNGGWNLHKLTMEFPLEHFVMFSSVVALFGPLGQSNHAASNSFLDALAHHRIASGLPATSINWGQWGQVGVAAGIEVAGLVPFSPNQGIGALEASLKTQRSQIAVLEADFQAIRRLFPQTKRYIEELKLMLDSGVQVKICSEKFWQDYDGAQEEEKYNVLKGYLENILRQILKLDKNEPIDENQNLQEMGLDSLMMVEMKNFLQTLMGSRVVVSASSLQDCHNVVDLTNRLVDLIEGSGDINTTPLTKEELNELIKEDSVLPEYIQPTETTFCKPSEVKTVLITGATGNLAPYILKEVSSLEQIETIYCLLRPNKKHQAMDRLLAGLKDKYILQDVNVDKIKCIEGNLGDQFFGLSEETYTSLASEVDGIIHCAVKSNHIEPYRKSERNKRDVRTINVGGTIKILEFATTVKTKLVLHASTMVAITKASDGCMPETWPGAEDYNDLPNVGYGISKFICDRLVHQATERGVPCKSLRFPGIAGDSKTGHHTLTDNHLMMRIISYMKMGMMPSLPLPFQLLPVDICASVAAKLFVNDECPFDIYNVTNPNCPLEQAFAQVGEELGYPIKVIDYSSFIKKLEEEGENSLLYPLKDLYFNEETFIALSCSSQIIQAWMVKTKMNTQTDTDFFRSAKLQKFVPEIVEQMELPTDTVKRDLHYSKKAGIFKKLGLEK
jgi:thioester reductase-like protein